MTNCVNLYRLPRGVNPVPAIAMNGVTKQSFVYIKERLPRFACNDEKGVCDDDRKIKNIKTRDL